VGDVDQRAGRVVLRDTKNRRDHKLLLSTQALEIAKRNCVGRKAEEPLFPIVDARKTLAWITLEFGALKQALVAASQAHGDDSEGVCESGAQLAIIDTTTRLRRGQTCGHSGAASQRCPPLG
jgi:hypothetical protein